MTEKKFLSFLLKQYDKPFEGWDFSYLNDTARIAQAPLRWCYANKVTEKIKDSEIMLDMCTGGGEFLSLLQPLPPITCATEAYKPNIPVAKANLSKIGVKVFSLADEMKTPFEDDFFDLVINRHGSFCCDELYRIMKQNSCFITQQVGIKNNEKLNIDLGSNAMVIEEENWCMDTVVKQFLNMGFDVLESYEEFPLTRFYDVGAIVYYLKAIPWQIPDFSVEKYLPGLLKIDNIIKEKGFYDINYHRFFISVKK